MRKIVRELDESVPIYPDEDYTGEWIVEWPSGALKFTGNFLNGLAHGKSFAYWENGQIAQTGMSYKGEPIGVWEDFFENGHKFKETIYENSSNFEERRFNSDGSISDTVIFKDGMEMRT
jgi:antitoxin component YwqK of YwqJK toxin-antitoxin module